MSNIKFLNLSEDDEMGEALESVLNEMIGKVQGTSQGRNRLRPPTIPEGVPWREYAIKSAQEAAKIIDCTAHETEYGCDFLTKDGQVSRKVVIGGPSVIMASGVILHESKDKNQRGPVVAILVPPYCGCGHCPMEEIIMDVRDLDHLIGALGQLSRELNLSELATTNRNPAKKAKPKTDDE